jgi:hypothetical protein
MTDTAIVTELRPSPPTGGGSTAHQRPDGRPAREAGATQAQGGFNLDAWRSGRTDRRRGKTQRYQAERHGRRNRETALSLC